MKKGVITSRSGSVISQQIKTFFKSYKIEILCHYHMTLLLFSDNCTIESQLQNTLTEACYVTSLLQ